MARKPYMSKIQLKILGTIKQNGGEIKQPALNVSFMSKKADASEKHCVRVKISKALTTLKDKGLVKIKKTVAPEIAGRMDANVWVLTSDGEKNGLESNKT